jgi:hypothetical protein
MAYTPVPAQSTGHNLTAAEFNQYVGENFAAGVPDIFEAAGDLAVASGANAAARLAAGADSRVLTVSGANPAWLPVVRTVVAGSTTDWSTDTGSWGSKTITSNEIRCGWDKVSFTAASTGTSVFNFGHAFATGTVPLVVAWPATPKAAITFSSADNATFTVNWRTLDGTNITALRVLFIAIGIP